ncbi:hypothetical protein SAY86_014093 [Trapa natans]|uniref:Enhancer of polycomb-like protein n=1 Tax=Trapa natans TaxID=22666 RepID=A0AAN7KMR4_TRANT|nr:hypothetical protein SAY86_014093 [Trapa natans]
MSRLSFRPRPLDIHKKLPIVKSVKDFEDDDTPTASGTRGCQLLRLSAADSDFSVNNNTEVVQTPTKKLASEIPIPQFDAVDTYERDYSSTFVQPTSYVRGRGARAELGEFVEYDLDNEDEDWLQQFNQEKNLISPERFEIILFKFEVLDHKARERAGLITPTFGSPISVLLQLDAAFEVLQAQGIKLPVFQSVFYYWKQKRERWQKPILRRLQPPPPVNDTNPYNVFRPREKTHRLHTRRMQRRENNVQSFEKLRQVRRNLGQSKLILEELIKREERKREAMEIEVSLQRLQMKYKHETELVDDGFSIPGGYPAFSSKFGSSEEEFLDSDDVEIFHPRPAPIPRASAAAQMFADSNHPVMVPAGIPKQEFRRRIISNTTRWLHRMDPLDPVLLFTKPLVPEKLAAAGIIPPSNMPGAKSDAGEVKFHGRIGRGGRIVFDRWNPLSLSQINFDSSFNLPPKPQASMYN